MSSTRSRLSVSGLWASAAGTGAAANNRTGTAILNTRVMLSSHKAGAGSLTAIYGWELSQEPTCHGIFTGPPYRVLPIQNLQRSLLYHDAVGAARFAIAAANKALLDPGLSPPVAVILGLMTGIGGGLLRDVLAGRPTLLMSRETYASPIVSGCSTFVTLSELTPDFQHAAAVGTTLIIGVRALAIWFHLEMPGWLVKRD